jgi:N-formylglutamate deformylase
VADYLRGRGYDVAVNDPYKGVELVRAFSNPKLGKHSLQLELNKRLYLMPNSVQRSAQFAQIKLDLNGLLDHLADYSLRQMTRIANDN